ncbi:hypothetical protein ABZP36_005117 [Zizania latifolia]
MKSFARIRDTIASITLTQFDFVEAAKECSTILDVVESALPDGLPDIFGDDCNFKATICRAVELFPELWKSGGFHFEAVSSYRRTLLEEDDLTALSLLKRILNSGEDSNSLKELILASKICCENSGEEGALYARRALSNLHGGCDQIEVAADLLLGISLSNQARCDTIDTKRTSQEREALEVLGISEKKMHCIDFRVMYYLSLENAKQRKLDTVAIYARKLLKLEAGSELKTWLLMAQIMTAQRRFEDAESIVNAALDQTGKWFLGELLQIKAKI